MEVKENRYMCKEGKGRWKESKNRKLKNKSINQKENNRREESRNSAPLRDKTSKYRAGRQRKTSR